MKKRFLAMLMAVVMLIGIIPTGVIAQETDAPAEITYGSYNEEGKWVQVQTGEYSVTENGITLSKTAVRKSENTYEVTLRVETSTTTSTVAAKAATVLVIDVSGSMAWCADCGAEDHCDHCTYEKNWLGWQKCTSHRTSRMAAAKTAAISFLDSYCDAPANSGRYVSVVQFSTNGWVAQDWIDVSGGTSSTGYTTVWDEINKMYADGGTNLDDGLYDANDQFSKSEVSGIKNKFTVALTDGVPTYARDGIGDGSNGSEEIISATTETAATLRGNSKVYTVCFGVADDYTYETWGGSKGPTVGNFLADSVATSGCAYNADNASDLYTAFANITEDITSGLALSGSKVTDPMGSVVGTLEVSNVDKMTDGLGFTWTLGDAKITPSVDEAGNRVKTYVYTKTYTVTLNDSEVNNYNGYYYKGYYPLNKSTTLTLEDGTVLQFPIPAVSPRYTVIYDSGDYGTLTGENADGQVVRGNLVRYQDTPTAPAVVPNDGYYFTGWNKTIADKVTESVTYVARYAPKTAVTITGATGTKTYNGSEQSVDTFQVEGLPQGYTLSNVTYKAARTDEGTSKGIFTGAPVIKDADGNDVTHQFKITQVVGTMTITPLAVNVTIVGNTGSLVYNGAEQSVTGYVATDDSSLYAETDFTFSSDATAKGTNVGTYPMGLTAEQFENTNTNFTVTFNVTDGALTITRATNAKIEVSAYNNVYDGAEHNALTSVVLTDGNDNVLNNEDWTITYVVDGKESADMPTIKDVSEKTVTVKATNPNYDPLEAPATAKVTPKAVTLTSASADKFYDGTPLVKDEVTAEGFVDGEGAEYDVTGSQTLAGSSKNTFTYKLNDNTLADNYDITTIEGTLTVAKKGEIVVTITENSGVYTYDGTEKAVKGYTVSISDPLYTEEDFEFEGEALVTGTYVGEYDMELTPENFVNINENFENVTFVIVDGTLVIKPIETVIDITADSNEKIYDGTPLTDDGYTFTENVLVEGDELVVVVEGTITDAGTVENKIVSYQVLRTAVEQRATVDVTECYTFGEITDGTLTVKPREVVITSGSDTKVYDGTPLTNCDIAAEGFVKGEGAMVTFTGSQLNAGISENTFTFVFAENTKAQNYTVIVVNGKLEVTPKAVTITSGSANKHYDGEPLTCDQITAEGFVEGEGAEYDITGSQTEVGTGKNTFTYKMKDNTLAENYTVTLVEGDLLVLPPIEIPNTGDNTNLVLYAGMMVASAAAFVTLLVAGKKKGKFTA